MSYAQRLEVPVTTDSSGDATGYTSHFTGRIQTVIYAKDDFADGVDFTITLEKTGEGVWTESDVNASAVRAPRQPVHSQAGVASLYAAAGEPVEDHIVAANDRVKIVVANGGDTKSGTFYVVVI